MALITTTETIGGRVFTHNRSDVGYMIKQDGTNVLYEDAYDPIDSGRTYKETDKPIEGYDAEAAAYELAGRILLGEED